MAITKSPSSAYRFGQQLCFCGAKPSFGYDQGIHNVTSKFCMQIPSKYRPGHSQLYRFHYANDTRAKRCRPGALHFGLPDSGHHQIGMYMYSEQAAMLGSHPATLLCSHRCGQNRQNNFIEMQFDRRIEFLHLFHSCTLYFF